MLERGTFGVTALWLERELDRGAILARRSVSPPRGLDIDRVLDPVLRAALLVDVLASYHRTGEFPRVEEPETSGLVHYIIHPVLKHVVLQHYAVADPEGEA